MSEGPKHWSGSMIKRIFGWLLFAYMAATLVLSAKELGKTSGTQFGVQVGVVIFIAALAGIGLMMGLGKKTDTGPPKDPKSD